MFSRIRRELIHWGEFLALKELDWADLLQRGRTWWRSLVPDDPNLGSIKNLTAGVASMALLFWLISGKAPWHLYLFTAFETPEFQNRLMFGFTLLLAIIFTGLVAGYLLHDLWKWFDRKIRWLVRRDRRLREGTRTNYEYRV